LNIRERAAADLKNILENDGGAGTSFTLESPDGQSYILSGVYGDIGYLIDPATGEPVQGRTIEAAYSMATLRLQTERVPEKGWRFICFNLNGDQIRLFVKRYEPDNTVGTARIKMGLNLE
jgi:hypothetical protein